MSISYEKTKSAYRFAFKRKINGYIIRATKLLPKAWDERTAYAYDVKETARLVAKHSGLLHSKPLIEDAVLLYLQEHAVHLVSFKQYMKAYHHMLSFYAGKTFDELPAVAIALNKQTHLQAGSRDRQIALLCAACNYGYKFHDMGSYKPSDKVQKPKVYNQREIAPPRVDVLRMARLCKNKVMRCAILTAYYSGMRRAEILRAVTDGTVFKLYDTKNHTTRFVPVHPKLRPYLKRFPLKLLKEAVGYQWRILRDLINHPEYHFHDLRHSHASALINSGADLYTVGKVLGHKTNVSTARYAHIATEFMAAAMSRIGRKSPTV